MNHYNDEIQLKEILIKLSEYKTELWDKKVKIILLSFLFFVFGILIAFFSTINHKAELTFVVENATMTNSTLGSLSGVASQFGFDVGGTSNSTFSYFFNLGEKKLHRLYVSQKMFIKTKK